MSTPDEILFNGHGRTEACADAACFLISAFPGSGADSLMAALVPMPGVRVLRPLELAARSRSSAVAEGVPSEAGTDLRTVAHVWEPRPGADGLCLVRNPFHILAELSATLSPDGPTPWARGALLGAIAQTLFAEEIPGLAPNEDTFASLLAGLWARHVRAVLASGLPILQYEHVLTAPDACGRHVATLASQGRPLPALGEDVLLLPPASVRADNTAAPLSDVQVKAIRLIAGDMMRACGYEVRDGALVIGPVPSPPFIAEAAAFAPNSREASAHAAADARLGRALHALEVGRQREQTFDTMSQVISDLCRQQDDSFGKSQREIRALQLEITQTRQALERLQSRSTQLQGDLATVRESYLTLADLDVVPPAAKCVRFGPEGLEIGRTRNTPARISFSLPPGQACNWLMLLAVTIEDADDSTLPPVVISYSSRGRARRIKHPVAAGDNQLAFILAQSDEGAQVHLLIAPRVALYRIEDCAVLPLTTVSRSGRSEPPAEEAPPET